MRGRCCSVAFKDTNYPKISRATFVLLMHPFLLPEVLSSEFMAKAQSNDESEIFVSDKLIFYVHN